MNFLGINVFCSTPGKLSPLLLAAFTTSALASEPLYVKNLSPVTGLLGLPSQRSALIQSPHTFAVAVHGSVANHYVLDVGDPEALLLDGESTRLAIEVRYGLAEKWDMQLEVPWLDHSEGQLDNLIESWHSLGGFSDRGRSDIPKNQLDYRYRGPGVNFAFDEDASGLGDVSLALSRVLYADDKTTASLALGYKFSVGDEDEFLGSGADDFFLALRASGNSLIDWPLNWHLQLGYLWAGDSGALIRIQESHVWFAGGAIDWPILDSLSLIVQLDAHSAPLQSELTALGEEAVLLSLGGRWRFARHWALDINVVEDARVETGPDVIFQASVRYFGG